MKVSASTLPDQVAVKAASLVSGERSEVLESGNVSEDSQAERYFELNRTARSYGRLILNITDRIYAPEHGDIVDGPSGESVDLVFKNGRLVSVEDKPIGYDALWGIDTVLERIIPSRRVQKKEQITQKATELITRAAAVKSVRDLKAASRHSY